jgi:hypothetical protein
MHLPSWCLNRPGACIQAFAAHIVRDMHVSPFGQFYALLSYFLCTLISAQASSCAFEHVHTSSFELTCVRFCCGMCTKICMRVRFFAIHTHSSAARVGKLMCDLIFSKYVLHMFEYVRFHQKKNLRGFWKTVICFWSNFGSTLCSLGGSKN